MACGKSHVATYFRNFGGHVIEADDLGREVMTPDGEAYGGVVQKFGYDVLAEDGTIDRAKLAELVFRDPAALARLNAVVHPAVRRRALFQLEKAAAKDPHGVAIYVAAILLESNAMQEIDKLIVVTCTPEQQMERALRRPGATPENVAARLSRQMPPQEKLSHADYVIDASGAPEDTERQTKIVYEELRKLAA